MMTCLYGDVYDDEVLHVTERTKTGGDVLQNSKVIEHLSHEGEKTDTQTSNGERHEDEDT